MAEIIWEVKCPIKKEKIDIGLCQDIQMVVDESVIQDVIKFKVSDEDRKICLNCKKRIDPSL